MARDAGDDLVLRFAEGDEEALRELFARHSGTLRRRIAGHLPRKLRRRLSVSDILQETHLVAFRRREEFEARGADGFGRWLWAIAEMKVREAVRRHGAAERRAIGREVTRGQRPDTRAFEGRAATPSEAAMASESVRLVRMALEGLPDDHREVLRLTRLAGLTLREASARMGRSYAAVRKLYGRALCRLAETFERLEKLEGG